MGANPGTGDAEPLRASCNHWPDRSTTSTRPSAEIRDCPDFVRSISKGTLCTVERSCQALVQPLVPAARRYLGGRPTSIRNFSSRGAGHAWRHPFCCIAALDARPHGQDGVGVGHLRSRDYREGCRGGRPCRPLTPGNARHQAGGGAAIDRCCRPAVSSDDGELCDHRRVQRSSRTQARACCRLCSAPAPSAPLPVASAGSQVSAMARLVPFSACSRRSFSACSDVKLERRRMDRRSCSHRRGTISPRRCPLPCPIFCAPEGTE